MSKVNDDLTKSYASIVLCYFSLGTLSFGNLFAAWKLFSDAALRGGPGQLVAEDLLVGGMCVVLAAFLIHKVVPQLRTRIGRDGVRQGRRFIPWHEVKAVRFINGQI